LHLNTTGVPVVRVQYTLRDIDGSVDNAVQPIALQYRVGTTGNFINVGSAFVADASAGPSLTLDTPVVVTLPLDAGNVSQLQLRWITANAPGNDEWIGIDDISVTAGSLNGTLGFSSTNYAALESDGNATITINRNDGSQGAVSVRARTILGGTATAGSDYTAFDQVINFADGQTTATFQVQILQDLDQEGAETVFLQLSDATGGAVIGANSGATLSIGDDDVTAPTGVLLNELNVNTFGTDNPFEYAEFRGPAGTSLRNVYFVSIEGEGDTANTGNASFVADLSAFSLGSNGLAILKADTGGHTIPGGTTVIPSATLANANGGALQNGSNSFLIIFSPLPILGSTDLDVNNDGVLELGPGAVVLDGVGWFDGSNLSGTDLLYAPQLPFSAVGLPANGTRDEAPDIATRFPTENGALDANAWYYGEPDQVNGVNSAVEYLAGTVTTTNPNGIPAGTVVLTPGAANFPSTGDTTPPTLDNSLFVFDAFPILQTINLTFSEDVAASLSVSDLTLTNTTTASVVPAGNIALSYNAGTNVASFTFPGFATGILPDGNYSLAITGAVEDAAGNALVPSAPFTFFTLGGDATRNKAVSLDDFTVLAANFGTSGQKFTTGDFTYDGSVNLNDFTVLAANFGASLPGEAPRASGGSTGFAGAFSATRIGDNFKTVREDVIG